MKLRSLLTAALVAGTALASAPAAMAQAKEQFFPLLSYRTGPYAPNGTPWANGKQDYLKMIMARDGGINGVKVTWEECETGKPSCRVAWSATSASRPVRRRVADRAAVHRHHVCAAGQDAADKIPLPTLGYGRSDAGRRPGLPLDFPLVTAATGPVPASDPLPRREQRRHGQAQGQEDRDWLPGLRIRLRADPGAAGRGRGTASS